MVDQKQCLFCRIIAGEIPAKKVYEDQVSLAFLDINPRNPGHTLLIPKKHAETIFDLPDAEGSKLFASLKKIAVKVKNGTKAHGLSICQNNGSAAGQVVGHVHFHLIPRFLNEGPAALEAMLPVRKMDEKSLDKVVAVIKGASTNTEQETIGEELEERIPEPAEERPEEQPKPARKEKNPSAKKPPENEEDDVDEFEEFNFKF
ncbi:MAG: HIT family protein [Candidatus Aenigmarchaeota archaeon]|nr:HIT family protein [Candidatus Aenigmarchaeota archaeon]